MMSSFVYIYICLLLSSTVNHYSWCMLTMIFLLKSYDLSDVYPRGHEPREIYLPKL